MEANTQPTDARTEYDDPAETEDWTTEDWEAANDLEDGEYHYVSVTGNITRHCPVCGYEGTADHPVRSRPTFEATLRHHCPNAECGALLATGAADE